MAWLLLRNDQLVLYLCPELKDASFETLGAKVAQSWGSPSTFDIAAELARIDANRRRRPARTAARDALRNKIHAVLGAGLKARQRAEREAAGSAPEVLAPSNRGRAHSDHRELRRGGRRGTARSPRARLCVAGTQVAVWPEEPGLTPAPTLLRRRHLLLHGHRAASPGAASLGAATRGTAMRGAACAALPAPSLCRAAFAAPPLPRCLCRDASRRAAARGTASRGTASHRAASPVRPCLRPTPPCVVVRT